MILEFFKKKPFIHFGLNRQKVTANLGDVIVVWNDNYNQISISSILSVVKIDNNKTEIICNEVGEFDVFSSLYSEATPSRAIDPNQVNGNTLKIIVQ